MNTRYLSYLLPALFLLTAGAVSAQRDTTVELTIPGRVSKKKFYFSNALDGGIFSLARIDEAGKSKSSTLRFSYFLNYGFNFNYDPTNVVGFFTGIGIKNIGFIEKTGDSTVKRRVYTVGAPLALKIGNLVKKKFLFLGGGIDIPINYKEKGFVRRKDKVKFNEFFSDRTPDTMPYFFVGLAGPTLSLKLQYYPDNFLNSSYEDQGLPMINGAYQRPYANYNVNVFMLSVGVNLTYNRIKEGQDRRVRFRAPRTKQA